jgi:serine/threonine protein kinase/Flp pilus assembly protein TadD
LPKDGKRRKGELRERTMTALGQREIRTCSVCGTKFSATSDSECCPVCALRGASGDEGEATGSIEPTSDPNFSEAKLATVPARFDNYELVKGEDGMPMELGRGAMGVTYKALDVNLRFFVTLKVISGRCLRDESARLRFLREARAAASLRHPNVASVFHLGTTGGNYFYAMEFVEGETLEQLVNRLGRLEVKLALEIATQIAAGLGAVHERNLVHRDIKPTNIMVSLKEGGSVAAKIIDLGLAKPTSETPSEPGISMPGSFAGTPEFASPEQFAGVSVDIRSDLYSLGVTLWEILTGGVPFRGSAAEVMYQHQHTSLPFEQLKGVSQPAVALLEALLEKDPAERFQSPAELLKAIPVVTSAIDAGRSVTRRRLRMISGQLEISCRRSAKASESVKALLAPFKTRFLAVLAICGGLILAFELFFGYHRLASQAVTAPKDSIAVLPFESLSENKNDIYFADGVQDDILSNLAKVSRLKVISRTSVMAYRPGGNRDLRSIASALGVARVVEGTVRRSGHRVRVTTELVDARTDETLWSESYDRDLTDIFAIQSDIAQTVASRLSARLSPDERKVIEEKPTNNLEAYDLYLRAKELIANARLFQTGDERENLLTAIRFLEEATHKDPTFALAYCVMAGAHDDLYWSIDRSAARRALGDAAVSQALHLQAGLPEAHLAAAFHIYTCYRDYESVRAHIAIAQRALPNNPDAFALAARVDRRRGQWDESTRGLQKAANLDPRNSEVLALLVENYLNLHRYREADQASDRLIEIAPNEPGFTAQKALCAFVEKGNVTGYRAALEALPSLARLDMWTTAARMYFAALDHDWAAAKEILSNSSNEELIFFSGTAVPRGCVEIWLARACGEHPTLEGRFAAARDQLKQRLDADLNNPNLLSALGIVDAALGRKDDAIQEAKRASEFESISEDAINGPTHVYSLAVVYAWSNEPNLAFEQLGILAKTSNFFASYGYLKLEPGFDPLRKDPRFDKLLAQLAPR